MAESFAIIKHQVFRQITDEEVKNLLPQSGGIPTYKIFDIRREIISMDEIHKLDTFEFRIYQKNMVESEIKPFISANPGCKVLYFGAASIPLALHLGYCFGGWQDIDVYLLHREKMTWNWANDDERTELPVITNYVKEEFSGPIDVIFKVEATYAIHDEEIKATVENPSKIISITPETIGKDIFRNQEQLKAFAHQFSLGIDSVANLLPNTDKIHLFPSVPVGLAFLLGTKVNPLITKPIVSYQYDINRDPKYQKILILQEIPQREVTISEEHQKFIAEIKGKFKKFLKSALKISLQAKALTKIESVTAIGLVLFCLIASLV